MKYVYGCPTSKDHPREEVRHGMNEAPRLLCLVCKAEMRRIPQAFTWGHRPFDVLLDRLETNYRNNRKRRSLSK